MASEILFYILSILGFVILLYLGMKFSKSKSKSLKIIGYFLTIISTLGILFDFYGIFSGFKF